MTSISLPKVVDCGSYTAAAEALGMADLEAQSTDPGHWKKELGVRLLNRTTRKTYRSPKRAQERCTATALR